MSDNEQDLPEEETNNTNPIPEYLMGGDNRLHSSMVMRLLDRRSSRHILEGPSEDLGLAENLPFPFMALIGQVEMRLALLLAVINPNVGGVLLIGPRGTGKTTAARGLSSLLPYVDVSACIYGCTPEDYEAQGEEGVCENCLAKLEAGERITVTQPVKMVELPLNARLEDVVGGINERMVIQYNQVRLDRGILSRADQNILYVDEVNLLSDEIVDAILDAAAQGRYTVRRGAMRATFRSRLTLIGSMNPEEGRLRPQILDRFGLRVIVTGLTDSQERLEVYERVRKYRNNPRALIAAFDTETFYARDDVITARDMVHMVELEEEAQVLGLNLIQKLNIHSLRAEFTLFEAARAYAAADLREIATVDDLRAVAPMALRIRGSDFIDQFIQAQKTEDDKIVKLFKRLEKGSKR